MDFSHSIARLRISRGGYSAGVEHHHLGQGVSIEHGPSGGAQGAAHRRGVCFGGATAKIFQRKGSHELRADSERGIRIEIIAATRRCSRGRMSAGGSGLSANRSQTCGEGWLVASFELLGFDHKGSG